MHHFKSQNTCAIVLLVTYFSFTFSPLLVSKRHQQNFMLGRFYKGLDLLELEIE